MNRLIIFVLMLILVIGCESNKNNESVKAIDFLQTTEIKKTEPTEIKNTEPIESEMKKEDSKKGQYILPIHGELNQQILNKYYPKITDTIRDLRIIGSEKIDLNLGNNVIVSLLHNTGTFDQMIICTHNKDFDLIDNLYIGKATDFDNGKSHTIEYYIKNKNEIIFTQTVGLCWRRNRVS